MAGAKSSKRLLDRNTLNPTFRFARSKVHRKEDCWSGGQRMLEEANAAL